MKYTLHDLIQARGVSEPLREAVKALINRLEAAEKERDELRAKIEEMEKQEPVGEVVTTLNFAYNTVGYLYTDKHLPLGTLLYALPGAQPELNLADPAVQKRLAAQWGYVPTGAQPAPSVPDGWKLVPIEPTPTMIAAALESSHAINAHRAEHCYRAMLAAAPEVKP